MTQVLSLRFRPGQKERLGNLARRMGRTPSETGALLIEESLRRAEFADSDFRDSPVGRQAYVLGSSLAVWEVVAVARQFGMDVAQVAAHLAWPEFRVQAALNYAAVYPGEMDASIGDNAGYDFATLLRLLPQSTEFRASE